MTSITTSAKRVNENPAPSCRSRTRWQIRRVLSMVDLLAPCRQAQTAHEITRQLNDRLGTSFSQRTVERDLELLASENVFTCERYEGFQPYSGTGVRVWRMRSLANENLQTAAVNHVDASPVTGAALYALVLYDDQLGWYRAPNEPRSLHAWQDTLYCLDGVATLVPVEDAERFAIGPRFTTLDEMASTEAGQPSLESSAARIRAWLQSVVAHNPPANPADFGMLAHALYRYAVAAFEGAPSENGPEACYTRDSAADEFEAAERGEITGGAFFTALGVTADAWADCNSVLPELERFAAGAMRGSAEPARAMNSEPAADEAIQPAVDDADNSDDGQGVTAYFVQYRSPLGKPLFLHESVNAATAEEMCDSFAKRGMSPMVYRLSLKSSELYSMPHDALTPSELKDQLAMAEGMEDNQPAAESFLSIRDAGIPGSLAAEDCEPADPDKGGYKPAVNGPAASERKDSGLEAFYVQYSTPGGQRFFLPEACDLQTTVAICRQLSQSGKAPVAFRTLVTATQLVESTGGALTLPELEAAEDERWGDDDSDADDATDVGFTDARLCDAVASGGVLQGNPLHPEDRLQPAPTVLLQFGTMSHIQAKPAF